MTRGPGRHSERNFRAAEQHYNESDGRWIPPTPFPLATLCENAAGALYIVTKQWWRRLVSAYGVKAGMVCLQCKKMFDPYLSSQR